MGGINLIIILAIIQSLLVILQAMGWYIVIGMMKRIEKAEQNIVEMKDANIRRFENIIKNQTDARVELLKEQTTVKEELVKAQHTSTIQFLEAIGNLKVFITEHHKQC